MQSQNMSMNVIVRIHPAGAILSKSWPAGLELISYSLYVILFNLLIIEQIVLRFRILGL